MIGCVLQDKYRVVELLGEGGMGIVYKALDEELNRPVALKLLKGEFSGNPQLVKRFHEETRVLASFNHPNITTIYSRFDWNGQPVMVMELLDGETFSAMIARRGPIPASICIPWFLQALAGVAEAHKHGIIHRDLKPANLLLTGSGMVKVMDFGIAKIEQALNMTRTSTMIGTPYYMSPEQVEPTRFGLQRVDSRTDIYSMGVTLYELLAGAVPFKGASEFAIQRAHLEELPQPPTVYYPHIPPGVVSSVLKAMAKDPSQRYQHAEEFSRDLDLSDAGAVPQAVAALSITQSAHNLLSATAPLHHTPLPETLPQATEPKRASTFHPTPAPLPVITTQCSQAPPEPRGLDRLLQRWFGRTGRPRLVGVSIASLLLALVTAASFEFYSTLERNRDQDASNHTYYGGGGGSPSGISGDHAAGQDSHEQASLPAPEQKQVMPSPSTIHDLLPKPKPSASANPAAVPPSQMNRPAEVNAPTTPQSGAHLVAGRWAGSFKRCESNHELRASLNLTEVSTSDATMIPIEGQLMVADTNGTQRCSVRGTFSKSRNRLTFLSTCTGSSTPDFLAAPHTSVVSIYNNQMSGTVLPDSPCMTIQFDREF